MLHPQNSLSLGLLHHLIAVPAYHVDLIDIVVDIFTQDVDVIMLERLVGV